MVVMNETDGRDLESENGSEQEMESDYNDENDFRQVLGEFFSESKKNRNIPEVLLEIKRTLDVHNKLMMQMIQAIQSK